MRQSIAVLSFLASVAFAQNSAVEFFFPGYDSSHVENPVASVVKANPSTTVLELACPTNVDSTNCSWGTGIELSIISTTIYQATVSADSASVAFTCAHNVKAEQLTCNLSLEGVTTTTVFPTSEFIPMTATITEGAELLSTTGAASPAASGAASPSQVASSGLKTSASATGTASAAASVSGNPAQATGAAFRFGVEGSALLALAGAAALNAW